MSVEPTEENNTSATKQFEPSQNNSTESMGHMYLRQTNHFISRSALHQTKMYLVHFVAYFLIKGKSMIIMIIRELVLLNILDLPMKMFLLKFEIINRALKGIVHQF